jgi:carbon storage regulator
MLVLTRKINESMLIDGGIEVVVVAVCGNKVRLGIRAPLGVSVHRNEIQCESGVRSQGSVSYAEPAKSGLENGG